MEDSVIRLEKVSKTFRDFWLRPTVAAVDSLDLEVRRGEVFGLLGPNGSGKSTTIKMILGLLDPSAGAVKLFGVPPRSVSARKRLGYLPELSYLHPFLTAKETLMYYAGLSGLPAKRTRARTAALLEEVGLTAAANRAVGGFSKGMARRVALAAALVAEPELLILDEPTSGLDPIGTRDVKDMIRSLAASGVTILMTSHLLGDTEDVCTHIAILSKGRVAACGRTDELLTRREDVRFTVSGLTAEEAARLTDEMTARYGPRVLMDHPRVPLEDFFAATLQEAT
jgi:ABC-2 type transport system ATP-binding protein